MLTLCFHRPEYAPQESSDEEDLEFGLPTKSRTVGLPTVKTDAEKEDRRLKRLQERQNDDDDEDEDMEER